MATLTKTNGTAKKETTTVKKEVQKKLAQQAIGKVPTVKTEEKLKGLAGQRERLSSTLTELTKFKYNQSDSASFFIKDSNGLEFKTTNSNLIHLVTNHLKSTLENRKSEIETQLIAFEL